MASGKLTKQELIEDLQELSQANPGNITRNYYRENGKYSESQWQKLFPKFSDFLAAAHVSSSNKTEPEINEIVGDTWSLTLPKTRICTLPELLEHCKVDLKVWEVERFVVNKWEFGSAEGGPQPLFQVKAQLKKRKQLIAIRQEIEDLKTIAKAEIKYKPAKSSPVDQTGLMLEINIPDIHFGKLAWPTETGGGPYDVKIAQATFLRALDVLLQRAKGYKFEEILFVVGNDLLHSNDAESKTAHGTIVDSEGRFQKTYWTARNTVIQAIERLRLLAPVKVAAIYGNHDKLSLWTLADALECYFHKDDRISINNNPVYRKYYEWGKVGLMLTHGDLGKREDYPLLFATEQPELFGRTRFREIHTGHLHATRTQEFHGVRVRILPALCPADEWHSSNGFVGNLRNAEAMVWSKTEGMVAQFTYSDNAYPEIKTKREIV